MAIDLNYGFGAQWNIESQTGSSAAYYIWCFNYFGAFLR